MDVECNPIIEREREKDFIKKIIRGLNLHKSWIVSIKAIRKECYHDDPEE